MQLDKTRVVIRERSWLDLLDLALAVLRTQARPFLACLAVGALPLALVNQLLLYRWLGDPLRENQNSLVEWLCFGLILIVIEVPLATAPLTIYLGELLFVEQPRPGTIAASFWRALPQLIVFQLMLRPVLILMVITAPIPFASWPFLNEIILLERNPFWARSKGAISTRRRSRALHSGLSGDLFSRELFAATLSLTLIFCLTLTLNYVRAVLGGANNFDVWFYAVEFPLAAWLVAGFFAVVRFLNYLDVRIRREGWEVELSLRAEAARLERQIV